MNAFYQKLNLFGSLVQGISQTKNIDMANYFIVVHPAHPIVKNSETTRPGIRFNDRCPRAIKREVAMLWKMVFFS
jgi:hypothetical protein